MFWHEQPAVLSEASRRPTQTALLFAGFSLCHCLGAVCVLKDKFGGMNVALIAFTAAKAVAAAWNNADVAYCQLLQ